MIATAYNLLRRLEPFRLGRPHCFDDGELPKVDNLQLLCSKYIDLHIHIHTYPYFYLICVITKVEQLVNLQVGQNLLIFYTVKHRNTVYIVER